MKLNAVELQKTDTCLTFALKRIGLFNAYGKLPAEEIEKAFTKKKIKSYKGLKIGSLLMVKHELNNRYDTHSIDEDGRVFYSEISTHYHFLVYEGNRLVDATTSSNGYMYIRVCKPEEYDPKKSKSKYFLLAVPK